MDEVSWRTALRWARAQLRLAGVPAPGAEAEYLARAGREDAPVALLHPERRPTPRRWRRYVGRVRRRAAREPLPYIRGEAEFYSLALRVNRDVLIPRPETETLVEAVLLRADSLPPGPLLELGTGSGAVAVALAVHLPERTLIATDVSVAALRVAEENARRHGAADRIRFIAGDLYGPIRGQRFAAVISNPPYVRSGDLPRLPPEIRRYEPLPALDGGPDGLQLLERIVRGAPRHLRCGGLLALETGVGQAHRVAEFCAQWLGESVQICCDLAGHERVVVSRYG